MNCKIVKKTEVYNEKNEVNLYDADPKFPRRQFDFGSSTPVIEGVTGSETKSEPLLENVSPLGGNSHTPKRFYILEMRPVISSNDFKMMFKVSWKLIKYSSC